MKNTLTYRRNGDYFIPNLTVPDPTPAPLGKYGLMRRTFLQQHRPTTYTIMLLTGTLTAHLTETDRAAQQRLDELEERRKELDFSILQEQIEKPPITKEQILFWFDRFRKGDQNDPAYQQQIIDCFVNSVYVFDDKVVVNFNYKEGDRLVSLQEVLVRF